MSERRKVLILEDSPMMCSLYRMVLAPSGAELRFAADGVEGLDRAAAEPDADLYIVDVNMPRMDGLEFIRRLRGELGLSGAPVIVVSTECSDADRGRALDAGANEYLCKPWEPDDLLALIDDLEAPAA